MKTRLENRPSQESGDFVLIWKKKSCRLGYECLVVERDSFNMRERENKAKGIEGIIAKPAEGNFLLGE